MRLKGNSICISSNSSSSLGAENKDMGTVLQLLLNALISSHLVAIGARRDSDIFRLAIVIHYTNILCLLQKEMKRRGHFCWEPFINDLKCPSPKIFYFLT